MKDQYGIDIPHISPEELLNQVSTVLERIEGCAYVVLIGAKGDPGNLRARSNVSDGHCKRMLRVAREAMDSGRLVLPGGN